MAFMHTVNIEETQYTDLANTAYEAASYFKDTEPEFNADQAAVDQMYADLLAAFSPFSSQNDEGVAALQNLVSLVNQAKATVDTVIAINPDVRSDSRYTDFFAAYDAAVQVAADNQGATTFTADQIAAINKAHDDLQSAILGIQF
jgi:hypothetical protein